MFWILPRLTSDLTKLFSGIEVALHEGNIILQSIAIGKTKLTSYPIMHQPKFLQEVFASVHEYIIAVSTSRQFNMHQCPVQALFDTQQFTIGFCFAGSKWLLSGIWQDSYSAVSRAAAARLRGVFMEGSSHQVLSRASRTQTLLSHFPLDAPPKQNMNRFSKITV
jgi:hypothetical protein